jgi:aspartate aminotransferase
MNISDRMLRMKPSATRAMADKAEQLKAQGKEVISLTAGEPDFPTPEAAFEYARQAMREGKTHYTTTAGFKELLQAIADYYWQRHGVGYSPKEILVGSGAKPLLFEAVGALINPGDEVIVPVPAWVSYVEQVDVFDGKSILLDTSENDFLPDLSAVENAITPRTRAIMINSPNNPTGAVYPRELMADLCRLAMKHNFVVICDEIYERLTYGVRHVNPLADVPEAKDVVLTINGVSKAYAMTGWRIGFALGPQKLISKMAVMQGHITSCASSVSQWASLGAILHAQNEVELMLEQYRQRMEYVYAALAAMPHIRVKKPAGAFYMHIDVRGCYGKNCQGVTITDDNVFCQLLMEHALVALVPGTAFMSPGFARLSYAASMDSLRQAMAAMRGFFEKLQ